MSTLPPWIVERDVHVVVRPQSAKYMEQVFPELAQTPITQIALVPRGWWRKENHFFPSHGFLDPNEMKNWR